MNQFRIPWIQLDAETIVDSSEIYAVKHYPDGIDREGEKNVTAFYMRPGACFQVQDPRKELYQRVQNILKSKEL